MNTGAFMQKLQSQVIRGSWSMLGSSAGYLVADGVSRAIFFGLLIAAAPLMPVESFAWVSLYLVLANVAALAVGLGTPSAVDRLYFEGPPFRSVLGVTLVVILGSGLLLMLLAGLLLANLSSWLLVPSEIVVAAVLAAPAIALRTAFVGTLRARSLVRACIAFQVGEAVLAVAAVVGLVATAALTHVTMAAALLGSTLITATVAVGSWARDPGMTVEPRVARAVLAFSIPLVLQGVMAYLIASYGQVLALPLLGPIGAGTYAYAYRFGMAMLLVSTAFSAAWTPAFLREAAALSEARSIKARVARYWVLMVLIAAGLMLALPLAAAVLGGPEYDSAASLIPIIVYAYIWHVAYNLVVVFHLESNQTAALAAGSTLAFGLSVALSIPLTLWLGLIGLAVSAPLAYGMLFGIQVLLTSESRRRSMLGDVPIRLVFVSACVLGVLPALLWAVGYPNA